MTLSLSIPLSLSPLSLSLSHSPQFQTVTDHRVLDTP